ncbi:hypothetical protein RUM44_006031 [Polyplax serrata]|uniref:Tonsoku-like protein n=1 Tax=Polyplax serrata TaxID=468196 RepID=A0ABR1AYT4_POLSC
MAKQEVRILWRKLKKARDNNKLRDISDLCCSLAACLTENEEYEEALNLYKESLVVSEALNYKDGIILANRMIAETCNSLGYFDEALKHVNAFLSNAQKEGNKVEEQRGFVLKGHVYFTHAEYLIDLKPLETEQVENLLEQSMDAYRASYAICTGPLQDINDKEKNQMRARLLQNKSLVFLRQDKLDQAQKYLIRAVKICAAEKLKDTECMCYLSLGDLYVRKEEYDNAMNMFHKAYELSTSTQRRIDSLVAKAKASLFKQDFVGAKTVLRNAYKLRANNEVKRILKQVISIIRLHGFLKSTPENDFNTKKELCTKLGNIYLSMNIFNRAVDHFKSVLDFCKNSETNEIELASCYRLLYKALINIKQFTQALFYCNQEIKINLKKQPERLHKSYYYLAKLKELNNCEFDEIHEAYIEAKSHGIKRKFKLNCLKCIIRLAKKYNKLDCVSHIQKELKDYTAEDSGSSCDSDSGGESEVLDSDRKSEPSSETDAEVWEVLQESEAENEEFDRPKERCRRSKFSIRRNEKGETELHVAAIKGNHRKVKSLIDKGHPVNVRDTAGWTPLHEACNHGYVDIVKTLLDSGADINDKGGPCCDGITPLHDAATNGQMEVINLLISKGASVLVLNNFGETPLQCLMNWKKNSALDGEENLMFKGIVKVLKSPLDVDAKTRTSAENDFINGRTEICGMKQKESTLLKKSPPNIISSKTTRNKEMLSVRQKKRQARVWSDEGSCSDESDSSTDLKENVACNMYKKAINNLRHKPKKFKTLECEREKSKRALIDEKNYIENCILDNDEEDNDAENADGEDESVTECDKQPSPYYETSQTLHENLDVVFSDFEDDCLDQFMTNMEVPSSPLSNRSEEANENQKPSLKDISGSEMRQTSNKADIAECNKVDKNKSPDTTKNCSSCSSVMTGLQENVSDTIEILVLAVNKDIKISVKKSELTALKVDWLTQEVAKQCPFMTDPDYYLTIKTRTRTTISESDALESLVGEKVEFVVTKWKLFPVWERYEKLCTRRNHIDMTSEVRSITFRYAVQPQITEILKSCSTTRRFTLSNLKLSALTLVPVCKAIKYESFVQTLNLSNNYFGDKGLELIVKILDKCMVEELDLSGCNVTSSGIYLLSDSLNYINEMSRNGLQTLNLSRNPITDDSVDAINNLVEKLPNLTMLNLERCELETIISAKTSPGLLIVQGIACEGQKKNSSNPNS